ncbi:TPA: ATP-binding protein [Klebsiella quasipneumoniae subsp. quasipneumoniae]|nr:ATP-binding protein [Klebsiella quasipneumoniae subsp. quasipneumoniae]
MKIINKMMQRKTFFINEQNELQVESQSGKSIQLSDLSSGEKQLLIVLGEALLQEKKNWIYIADEPELSLHVKWQEKLVDNLLSINPNAQIVFATHSPDVVSHYGNNIFDMELKLNELF